MLPILRQYYVFVSSDKHIKEYTTSRSLDLHTAYDDVS